PLSRLNLKKISWKTDVNLINGHSGFFFCLFNRFFDCFSSSFNIYNNSIFYSSAGNVAHTNDVHLARNKFCYENFNRACPYIQTCKKAISSHSLDLSIFPFIYYSKICIKSEVFRKYYIIKKRKMLSFYVFCYSDVKFFFSLYHHGFGFIVEYLTYH